MTELPKTILLLSRELETDNAGEAPKEILLLEYGETLYSKPGKKGKYKFDEAHADIIIAEFEANGVDIMFDYNHQQLRAKSNGKPAPASGWGTALEKRSDGLWSTVKWTTQGGKYIKEREYRYISPAVLINKDTGFADGIYNIALTNVPATKKARELIAAEFDFDDYNDSTQNQGDRMKTVLELLELSADPEGGDEAAIHAAVKNLLTKNAAADKFLATVREPLALEADATLDVAAGTILGLVEKAKDADSLTQRLEALEAANDQTKLNDRIEAAKREGKLFGESMVGWAKGLTLEALESFLESAPVNPLAKRVDRKELPEQDETGNKKRNDAYLEALDKGDIQSAILNCPVEEVQD